MTKWVETKLGDVVNIKHGYAFDGKHFHDEPVDARELCNWGRLQSGQTQIL
jgi:hypothetical protein